MHWTDVKVPKEFVALAARGDRHHAARLWEEPIPLLGFLAPAQLWSRPGAGPLETTVMRQDIIRLLVTGFVPVPTFGGDLPFAPVPETVNPASRPNPGRVNGNGFLRRKRRSSSRTLPMYRSN